MFGLVVAWVLVRYEFFGKGAMYSLFAAGLMFPVTVAITPLYLLVRNLGLRPGSAVMVHLRPDDLYVIPRG